MSETIRRRLRVHGEGQGGYFRHGTKEKAQSEGVNGWARNCDDGTVEVVAEGPSEAVDAVVKFCRDGTEQAQVESVDVSEEEPEGLEGFSTR